MAKSAQGKGIALAAFFGILQAPALLAPQGAWAQTQAGDASLAQIIKELAPRLGYERDFQFKAKSLAGGEKFRVAKVTLEDGARRTAVVVKRYPSLTTFYRGLIYVPIPARHIPRLTTSATALKATVEMAAAFKAAGLNTMDILLAIPKKNILVMRFLDGAVGMDEVSKKAAGGDKESLSLVEELGRKLAQVHRAGLAVGDMGPANAMAANGEIYFMDLDHASRNGNKAYDVSHFLVMEAGGASIAAGQDTLVARTFLKGYLENGGSAKDVDRAIRLNIVLPSLRYVKSPRTVSRVRRHMEAAIAALRQPMFDR